MGVEKMSAKKIFIYISMCIILLYTVVAYNCMSLPSDIVIEIDQAPYIQEINSFFGVLPNDYKTTALPCWSYIKDSNDDIIQLNPKKTDIVEGRFSFSKKREESRENFLSENGVVSAYFTYNNLVAYTEFVLGVMCVDNATEDEIVGEICITPQYEEMKRVGTRSVWIVNNAEMLTIMFLALLIIIMFLGAIYRGTKKLF